MDETMDDEAARIGVMVEKSGTTGVESVLRRGLTALREGPTRTARQLGRHRC
jgi:hypothetical protein